MSAIETEFYLTPYNLTQAEERALRDLADSLNPGHLRDALYALVETFETGWDATLQLEWPWSEWEVAD